MKSPEFLDSPPLARKWCHPYEPYEFSFGKNASPPGRPVRKCKRGEPRAHVSDQAAPRADRSAHDRANAFSFLLVNSFFIVGWLRIAPFYANKARSKPLAQVLKKNNKILIQGSPKNTKPVSAVLSFLQKTRLVF